VLTWLTLSFGFLTIAIPVWSIEKGHWMSPQPSLITTLAISTIAAIVFFIFRLNRIVVGLVCGIAGFVVMGWQCTLMMTPTGDTTSFQLWWQSFTGFSPNENNIYFAMFLVLVTWLIGFFSIRILIKKHSAWFAVTFGTLMLFINLANLPRENYYFLPLYFISSIILLGFVNFSKIFGGTFKWKDKTIRLGVISFFVSIAVVAVVAGGVAYAVPVQSVKNIGIKINTDSLITKTNQIWFNVFAGVSSKWTIKRSNNYDKLTFKKPVENSSIILFKISSSQYDYWRTRRWDEYQSWGWTSDVEPGITQPANQPISYEFEQAATTPIHYSVENLLETDIILSCGDIQTIDISVRVQPFIMKPGDTVPISGQFREPATVTSFDMMSPYETYHVTTTATIATPKDLLNAESAYPVWIFRYLQLPDTFPNRLRILAGDLTQYSPTPYEKAIAIKKYLNNLKYDVNVKSPPDNVDGVEYLSLQPRPGSAQILLPQWQ
jgi:transglutaminase-like putative cysteine protease